MAGHDTTNDNSAKFLADKLSSVPSDASVRQSLYRQVLACTPEEAHEMVGTVRPIGDSDVGTLSENVMAVLLRAREMAQRISGQNTIHTHHLVAALLSYSSGTAPISAHVALANNGVDLKALREDYYAHVNRRYPHAAWTDILVLQL